MTVGAIHSAPGFPIPPDSVGTSDRGMLSPQVMEKCVRARLSGRFQAIAQQAWKMERLSSFEEKVLCKLDDFSVFAEEPVIATLEKIFSSSQEMVDIFLKLATTYSPPHLSPPQFRELVLAFSEFLEAFAKASLLSSCEKTLLPSVGEIPPFGQGGKKWLKAYAEKILSRDLRELSKKTRAVASSNDFVQRRERANSYASTPIVQAVHCYQFFSEGPFFISWKVNCFFGNSWYANSHTFRHVQECVAAFGMEEIHYFRISRMLDCILSPSPDVKVNVEILVFLLVKIREKLGETYFLMLTQPSSYVVDGKSPSLPDVMELFQNLLCIFELGRLDQEIVTVVRAFHQSEMQLSAVAQQIIAHLRAVIIDSLSCRLPGTDDCVPLQKLLKKAVLENDLNELDCRHVEQIFVATSWKRSGNEERAFVEAVVGAKKRLRKDLFDLMMTPLAYENVSGVNMIIRLLRQVDIVSTIGGNCEELVRTFSLGRMGACTLDRLLEQMKIAISDARSPEGVLHEVLQRFSCSAQERAQLQTDYEHIFRIGNDLRLKNMEQLVQMAKQVRRRCEEAFAKLAIAVCEVPAKGRAPISTKPIVVTMGEERSELYPRRHEQSAVASFAKASGASPITREDSYTLIAIAREAIRKEFGIYPYNTQVLALLGLINHPTEFKGRIAQVKTGEGKSTIIAMLALYLACQGLTVDIVSSSRYLAERDEEKYNSFFKLFGIPTSHLCTDKVEQSNFAGQIIYGTNFDFEFAIMRDYFSAKPMRVIEKDGKPVPRPCDVVIVDEVDNMFIDASLNSARIAIPGNTSLKDVYESIFRFVRDNLDHIHDEDKVDPAVIQRVRALIGEQPFSQLGASKVEILLHSAHTALQRQENEDYVIKSVEEPGEEDSSGIVIVDKGNTGRLAEKSRWTHGVHQFLEIKHGLPVRDEHVMPSSLCHPVFFGMYHRIFGLSGTVGGEVERAEIVNTYRVDVVDVPPHRPSRRQDCTPVVCFDEKSQTTAIIKEILEMKAANRPTLILFETIRQTNEFALLCTSKGILVQMLNARQLEEEEYVVAKAGMPGMVTIATNTAGRGTDIVLHHNSLFNGGLHVILTYLPHNQRVEQQGLGRAGRQGQPGSSRIICLIENPIIQLLSQFRFDVSELQTIQYDVLLKLRDMVIAKESEERQFRTAIERMNNEYLQQFLQKFSVWQASHRSVEHDTSLRIQQEWAGRFYDRLDELLWTAQQQHENDPQSVMKEYQQALRALYDRERERWESLF